MSVDRSNVEMSVWDQWRGPRRQSAVGQAVLFDREGLGQRDHRGCSGEGKDQSTERGGGPAAQRRGRLAAVGSADPSFVSAEGKPVGGAGGKRWGTGW